MRVEKTKRKKGPRERKEGDPVGGGGSGGGGSGGPPGCF